MLLQNPQHPIISLFRMTSEISDGAKTGKKSQRNVGTFAAYY